MLDPEQNSTFQDHYLDMPFDLSQSHVPGHRATTATGIPPPLIDRMEVIEVPGYTRSEKLGIAARVPGARSSSGRTGSPTSGSEFTSQGIETHRRPLHARGRRARNLEREIAAVCRATAVQIAEGDDVREAVTPEHVERVLGAAQATSPRVAERELAPGVATGLALDAGRRRDPLHRGVDRCRARATSSSPATCATSCRSRRRRRSRSCAAQAELLAPRPEWLKEIDLHMHVPQHGTPQDGPSAGRHDVHGRGVAAARLRRCAATWR